MAVGGRTHNLKLAVKSAQEMTLDKQIFDEVMQGISDEAEDMVRMLSRGKHPVEVIIRFHKHDQLQALVPTYKDIYGKEFPTKGITYGAENWWDVDSGDKRRLNRAATKIIMDDFPKDFQIKAMRDISWFFKMFAIDAARTVVDVMNDKKTSAATRLQASQDVLNRAGYKERADDMAQAMPVRVSINFNKTPVSEDNINDAYLPDAKTIDETYANPD
jgi:hypothetical protein